MSYYQSTFVHILFKKKGDILNKPLNIGKFFWPPNELTDSYNEFIRELSPILSKLDNNNNNVIIAGDFNSDLLKLNDKHIISEYCDTLTSHSFYPKITFPTRLSNIHGTLIDNFICKLTETLDITSGIVIKRFSAHQP